MARETSRTSPPESFPRVLRDGGRRRRGHRAGDGHTAVHGDQDFLVGAVAMVTFLLAHALVTLGRTNR